MSEATEVKTLTIDGQEVSARRGQTILESRRRTASISPRSATWTA